MLYQLSYLFPYSLHASVAKLRLFVCRVSRFRHCHRRHRASVYERTRCQVSMLYVSKRLCQLSKTCLHTNEERIVRASNYIRHPKDRVGETQTGRRNFRSPTLCIHTVMVLLANRAVFVQKSALSPRAIPRRNSLGSRCSRGVPQQPPLPSAIECCVRVDHRGVAVHVTAVVSTSECIGGKRTARQIEWHE